MPETDPTGEDIQFVDADEYHPTPPGAVTYEQIVLKQIDRCITEGSKEMSGGYWKDVETSKGAKQIYVPDQKQIYLQSIDSLYDVLLAHFDPMMVQADDEFHDLIKNIKDDKITKLKAQLVMTQDLRDRNDLQMQIHTGYLDPNSYYAKVTMDEKLQVYRGLFQQLLLLFNRARFLMSQSISD